MLKGTLPHYRLVKEFCLRSQIYLKLKVKKKKNFKYFVWDVIFDEKNTKLISVWIFLLSECFIHFGVFN